MSRYFAEAGVACGTDLPIINIAGGTAVRIQLFELLIGFSTAPADIATLFKLVRTTDAGTGGSALTAAKDDPLTVAATGAPKSGTYGTPPTDEAQGFRFAINQRATHRIVTDKPLISAAAANNGIMLNSQSSGGTPTADATMRWSEGAALG
jgi:hypothetical protein